MLNEFFLRMKNILKDDYEAFVEALEKPAFQLRPIKCHSQHYKKYCTAKGLYKAL